jgi:hypothetical protein
MTSIEPVPNEKPNRVDDRSFPSKSAHLMEKHLAAQYRDLAIPGVVAALVPGKERADRSRAAQRLSCPAET